MKLKRGIAVGLCCVATIVSAQEVVTLGTFGFSKVDKPAGKLSLVGVCFGSMTNSTLNDVCPIEQYNGSRLVNSADRIIVWDATTQAYSTYALYDNGSGVKEWRDYNDFYGSAENPSIPVGSGFWVNSLGSSTDTNLVISGSVITEDSVTNHMVTGLQLMGYSFSTEADLNNTALKDQGAGSRLVNNADRVIAWNVSTQAYETYALYDDGNGVKEWRDYNNFYSAPGAIPVDLGHGFWYDAKSTFDWIEQNPYASSL